jgi:N6-adenosine-specific RNA methylase IME4
MAEVLNFPFRLGGWGCLHIDPPWFFEDQAGRMRCPYPPMTDDEILAMPVASVAADACHLYLWTTAAHRELAHACVRKWGFVFKHDFTWIKLARRGRRPPPFWAPELTAAGVFPKIGGGHWGRHAHESCLFAVRNGTPRNAGAGNIPTWFAAPVGEHSEKPATIYQIAEHLSPGPRLDIFARARRPGWDAYGNEVAA